MTTELVSVVIEHDGQLCQLAIPSDRKAIALHLLRGLFDDGVLEASRPVVVNLRALGHGHRCPLRALRGRGLALDGR